MLPRTAGRINSDVGPFERSVLARLPQTLLPLAFPTYIYPRALDFVPDALRFSRGRGATAAHKGATSVSVALLVPFSQTLSLM